MGVIIHHFTDNTYRYDKCSRSKSDRTYNMGNNYTVHIGLYITICNVSKSQNLSLYTLIIMAKMTK